MSTGEKIEPRAEYLIGPGSETEIVVIFHLGDARTLAATVPLVVGRRSEPTEVGLDSGRPVAILGASLGSNLGIRGDGQLQSIGFNRVVSSRIEALWESYNLVSHALSVWSLCDGVSAAIRFVEVVDVDADLVIKSEHDLSEVHTTIPELCVPPEIVLRAEHRAMLSLYRECRNSNSPFYAMLCGFKIVEAFIRYKTFNETDRLVIERRIARRQKKPKINERIIQMALATGHADALRGMSYERYMKHVRPLRNRIAHGIMKEHRVLDLDQGGELLDVAVAANLLDLMAQALLHEELWLTYAIQQSERGDIPDKESIEFFREHRFTYLLFNPHGEKTEATLKSA